jgi:hypothetical protein
MVGQYLLNTNENFTVYILQTFLEINKALLWVREEVGNWIR